MTLFRYGPQVCGSLDAGARREWLLTDGRGGYAMGTASGLRTRRYHGLLVVASGVPARRHVALVSLDPIVVLESGAQVRLATHEWASAVVAPQGHELLASFEVADGLPTWRWRIGDVVLERTVAMRHGEPGVAVVHTLVAGGPVRLVVEPLCTWRDGHGERAAGDLPVEHTGDGFVVAGAYRVRGPAFAPDGEWYRQVWHREEAARGLNASEDLFRPGQFAAHLRAGQRLEISAWAGDREALAADAPPAADVVTAARRRHQELAAPGGDMLTRALRLAADAFIMTTATGPDVVAGYPWFGAWSRDTMIAYPGLFLATGRVDQGRELLRGYARTLSAGMLANTADTGRVEHNTADATLWFLHAVDRHVHHTGDTDLAAELVDALDQVVRHHRAGTRYGIRVDPADGLLTQGAPGVALTWMDAVVDGAAVTPRAGKAVELNALWINGLAAVATIRTRLGRSTDDLDALHGAASASFAARFRHPAGWLCDVVDRPAWSVPSQAPESAPSTDDGSMRPNQLFAFGLPYGPLRGAGPAPVRAIGQALLTPLGLRTLPPDDPAYQARHRGDPAHRDRAYHQGTVWPWLLGAYADAAAATGVATDGLLDGVAAHLADWGVGSISETADAAPPHDATGCPFQAWSVAEVLRIAAEV